MLYGEPRMTNDIDMIVHLTDQQALHLPELFPFERFYCPPVEVILSESRRASRGHFNLIHHDTGHKADIYLRGSDELQAWGLSHRKQASLGPDQSLWLAPPEYVILRKLEFYREGGSSKHLTDIRGMLDGNIPRKGA